VRKFVIMSDLNSFLSAQNVAITGDKGRAVVDSIVSGNPLGLLVRNIPASGLIQPVAETPDATNAFTPLADNPQDYESFSISKNTGGVVYGLSGYNSSNNPLFIQIHNSDILPVSGSIPTILIYAYPKNNFYWDGSKFGMHMSSGITWCSSITGPSYTPDTTTSGSVWVNLIYK